MRKLMRAVLPFLLVLLSFPTAVPAFADHIDPRPVEAVGRVAEYLPAIVISVLGLVTVTAAVLVIVFTKKRNKKKAAENPEEESE